MLSVQPARFQLASDSYSLSDGETSSLSERQSERDTLQLSALDRLLKGQNRSFLKSNAPRFGRNICPSPS